MRYLVSGYYGEGNLGDEAILAGILREIRGRDAAASFTVVSFDPPETESRHGVAATSTSLRDPGRWRSLMREHDVLISGGGSFLHEADFDLYGRSFWFREGRLRPVPYFLSVVSIARLCGVPVVWYAQGLGPLRTSTARRAVAALASVSQAVLWRDRDSAALAAEIGVRAAREAIVPDPAYSVPPATGKQVAEALSGAGVEGGSFVAVCLRPWLEHTLYQERVIEALAPVAADRGLRVLFVPLQPRLDGPLAESLASNGRWGDRARVLRGVDDPRMIAGVLGHAETAVTMRLHAGILAAAAGTPAVIVSYDPKVTAFAAQTRQEGRTVTVEELEEPGGGERLARLVYESLDRNVEHRAALARTVARLRAEAGLAAALTVQAATGELVT